MQNSELKKELLGPHREVSARELENYLNGKLSDSEARAVESKLHSSEFSAMAADGFRTYGNTTSITGVGKMWTARNYSWLIWSSVSLILLLVAGSWFFRSSESSQIAENVTAPSELVSSIVEEPYEEETLKTSKKKTSKNAKENPQKEPTEITDNSLLEDTPILFSKTIEEEVFQLKTLSLKDGQLNLLGDLKSLKTQRARLRHYRKFKLVDQGIGIDQSLLKPILNGTEPFKETINVNPKYPEWMPADSVYNSSLNEAMDWLIEEDYANAKMRFKRLFENTQEDLTATFYLGYTLYLNKEFDKAIYYLDKAQLHVIQTYDQDARFIKIKCLLELDLPAEAREEAEYLHRIGSFYADKAMELVQ